MVTTDTVHCPDCLDGEAPCLTCGGDGCVGGGAACQTCLGEGIILGSCKTCSGSGELERAYARLLAKE